MLRHSESIAKLAPALVKAQAAFENATKNATNPHLGNKYANLEEVLRVVKPVLAAHGLAVVQMPGLEGDAVTLESMLLHESGEWIVGVSGAPLPIGRTNKKGDPIPVDAQDVGSAITYLRRYALAALASITQEDDDGQGIRKSGADLYISEKQAADLLALMDEVQADADKFLAFLKVPEVGRIASADYQRAVKALERKRAENGAGKKAAAR